MFEKESSFKKIDIDSNLLGTSTGNNAVSNSFSKGDFAVNQETLQGTFVFQGPIISSDVLGRERAIKIPINLNYAADSGNGDNKEPRLLTNIRKNWSLSFPTLTISKEAVNNKGDKVINLSLSGITSPFVFNEEKIKQSREPLALDSWYDGSGGSKENKTYYELTAYAPSDDTRNTMYDFRFVDSKGGKFHFQEIVTSSGDKIYLLVEAVDIYGNILVFDYENSSVSKKIKTLSQIKLTQKDMRNISELVIYKQDLQNDCIEWGDFEGKKTQKIHIGGNGTTSNLTQITLSDGQKPDSKFIYKFTYSGDKMTQIIYPSGGYKTINYSDVVEDQGVYEMVRSKSAPNWTLAYRGQFDGSKYLISSITTYLDSSKSEKINEENFSREKINLIHLDKDNNPIQVDGVDTSAYGKNSSFVKSDGYFNSYFIKQALAGLDPFYLDNYVNGLFTKNPQITYPTSHKLSQDLYNKYIDYKYKTKKSFVDENTEYLFEYTYDRFRNLLSKTLSLKNIGENIVFKKSIIDYTYEYRNKPNSEEIIENWSVQNLGINYNRPIKIVERLYLPSQLGLDANHVISSSESMFEYNNSGVLLSVNTALYKGDIGESEAIKSSYHSKYKEFNLLTNSSVKNFILASHTTIHENNYVNLTPPNSKIDPISRKGKKTSYKQSIINKDGLNLVSGKEHYCNDQLVSQVNYFYEQNNPFKSMPQATKSGVLGENILENKANYSYDNKYNLLVFSGEENLIGIAKAQYKKYKSQAPITIPSGKIYIHAITGQIAKVESLDGKSDIIPEYDAFGRPLKITVEGTSEQPFSIEYQYLTESQSTDYKASSRTIATNKIGAIVTDINYTDFDNLGRHIQSGYIIPSNRKEVKTSEIFYKAAKIIKTRNYAYLNKNGKEFITDANYHYDQLGRLYCVSNSRGGATATYHIENDQNQIITYQVSYLPNGNLLDTDSYCHRFDGKSVGCKVGVVSKIVHDIFTGEKTYTSWSGNPNGGYYSTKNNKSYKEKPTFIYSKKQADELNVLYNDSTKKGKLLTESQVKCFEQIVKNNYHSQLIEYYTGSNQIAGMVSHNPYSEIPYSSGYIAHNQYGLPSFAAFFDGNSKNTQHIKSKVTLSYDKYLRSDNIELTLYDKEGNVATVEKVYSSDNATINLFGFLIQSSYLLPNDSYDQTSYTYNTDPKSPSYLQLLKAENKYFRTEAEYDNKYARLISKTNILKGKIVPKDTYTTSYKYDENGLLSSISDTNTEIKYNYKSSDLSLDNFILCNKMDNTSISISTLQNSYDVPYGSVKHYSDDKKYVTTSTIDIDGNSIDLSSETNNENDQRVDYVKKTIFNKQFSSGFTIQNGQVNIYKEFRDQYSEDREEAPYLITRKGINSNSNIIESTYYLNNYGGVAIKNSRWLENDMRKQEIFVPSFKDTSMYYQCKMIGSNGDNISENWCPEDEYGNVIDNVMYSYNPYYGHLDQVDVVTKNNKCYTLTYDYYLKSGALSKSYYCDSPNGVKHLAQDLSYRAGVSELYEKKPYVTSIKTFNTANPTDINDYVTKYYDYNANGQIISITLTPQNAEHDNVKKTLIYSVAGQAIIEDTKVMNKYGEVKSQEAIKRLGNLEIKDKNDQLEASYRLPGSNIKYIKSHDKDQSERVTPVYDGGLIFEAVGEIDDPDMKTVQRRGFNKYSPYGIVSKMESKSEVTPELGNYKEIQGIANDYQSEGGNIYSAPLRQAGGSDYSFGGGSETGFRTPGIGGVAESSVGDTSLMNPLGGPTSIPSPLPQPNPMMPHISPHGGHGYGGGSDDDYGWYKALSSGSLGLAGRSIGISSIAKYARASGLSLEEVSEFFEVGGSSIILEPLAWVVEAIDVIELLHLGSTYITTGSTGGSGIHAGAIIIPAQSNHSVGLFGPHDPSGYSRNQKRTMEKMHKLYLELLSKRLDEYLATLDDAYNLEDYFCERRLKERFNKRLKKLTNFIERNFSDKGCGYFLLKVFNKETDEGVLKLAQELAKKVAKKLTEELGEEIKIEDVYGGMDYKYFLSRFNLNDPIIENQYTSLPSGLSSRRSSPSSRSSSPSSSRANSPFPIERSNNIVEGRSRTSSIGQNNMYHYDQEYQDFLRDNLPNNFDARFIIFIAGSSAGHIGLVYRDGNHQVNMLDHITYRENGVPFDIFPSYAMNVSLSELIDSELLDFLRYL